MANGLENLKTMLSWMAFVQDVAELTNVSMHSRHTAGILQTKSMKKD